LDAGDRPLDIENYSGVIMCGGPASAKDQSVKIQTDLDYVQKCLDTGTQLLGIYLDMQLLCKAASGIVVPAPTKEIGFRDNSNRPFKVELTSSGQNDQLFSGCTNEIDVFQLHGETVVLNDKIELLGTGDICNNQVIKVGNCAYGIQSHIELTDEMFE